MSKDESINARASQGFIDKPHGSVEQQYGDRTATETAGGDAAGRDIYKPTMLNYITMGADVVKPMTSERVTTLLTLLSQINNQDSVQQAYQDCLPKDANLFLQEPKDNVSILNHLLKEFEEELVSKFVSRLIENETIPQQVRNQLKDEVSVCDIAKSENLQTPQSAENRTTNQKLTPYLMVVLRPTSNTGQFLVNAWLIPDDTDSTSLDRFQPLDLNEEQKGKNCAIDEVAGIIEQFIARSRRHLRGKRYYPITLEVFLPLEYLSSEVDHWEISVRNRTLPIGVKHPLIIRSYERLCFDYLDDCWSEWCDNWEQFKTYLNQVPSHELFEKLEEIDTYNWDEVLYNFRDQPEKIGFIIPCLPCEEIQEDLFNTIIDSSAPCAIWIRRTIPGFEHIAEFTKLLEDGPLRNLPECIRKLRDKARVQKTAIDSDYAYHLSILWEDPNRLTPDVMIQLQSPG